MQVRALACLNIKNLLDSRQQARTEELAQRWLMLDPQLRLQAKVRATKRESNKTNKQT